MQENVNCRAWSSELPTVFCPRGGFLSIKLWLRLSTFPGDRYYVLYPIDYVSINSFL